MNVGILTFFNAHNYGAVLQAYALKNYISSLGHHCVILNYRNKYIDRTYPQRLKPRIRKKDFLNPKRICENKREIRLWAISRKSWAIQYQKFEDFIVRYLLDGKCENWREQADQCDLILFGSDQIWEKNIIGTRDKIFRGDFQTTASKVSYAASCYSEQSAMDEKLINSLKKFKSISVREEKIAEILKSRLGRNYDVETVYDPVFLPDIDIYQKFFKKPAYIDTPYILFYMVVEDKELSKISEYFRKECGRNILEIHYYKDIDRNEDWQRADVGPQEFIGLIKNAEYIFTNSFHGTAFSLIFHKQFIAVSRNMRILNLLQTLGLDDRAVLNLDGAQKLLDIEIIYDGITEKMDWMLEKSRQFLNAALKED